MPDYRRGRPSRPGLHGAVRIQRTHRRQFFEAGNDRWAHVRRAGRQIRWVQPSRLRRPLLLFGGSRGRGTRRRSSRDPDGLRSPSPRLRGQLARLDRHRARSRLGSTPTPAHTGNVPPGYLSPTTSQDRQLTRSAFPTTATKQLPVTMFNARATGTANVE